MMIHAASDYQQIFSQQQPTKSTGSKLLQPMTITWHSCDTFLWITEDRQAKRSSPTHCCYTLITYVRRGKFCRIKTFIPNIRIYDVRDIDCRIPTKTQRGQNRRKWGQGFVWRNVTVHVNNKMTVSRHHKIYYGANNLKRPEWAHCFWHDAFTQHMSETSFSFDRKICEQIKWTLMGSPVSNVITEAGLQKL